MIKIFFVAILFSLFSIGVKAEDGDWRIHLSYHDVTSCEVVGDEIYVLASGSLFVYDKKDNSIYTYDNLNTLSDIDITHIVYSKEINALVIVYRNANIDILYTDGYVYNISDFKNKVMADKTINSINVYNKTAYLNTNFGIVLLDLEKLEFENTYSIKEKNLCSYVSDKNIYVGTEGGIYKGAKEDNLLDPANWKKINDSKTYSINEVGDKLVAVIDKKGVCTITENGDIETTFIANTTAFKYSYSKNNTLYVAWNNKLSIINSVTSHKTYKTDEASKYIFIDGNTLWSCKGEKGFVESKIIEDEIVDGENFIAPNSPIRNLCEYMHFVNDNKLLVAGGTLNYFDKTLNPGTLMEYNYNDDKWTNFPEEEVKAATNNMRYVNMCSIDEDPTEPGHYFASSFGQGLYEFRNGEFVAHYNQKNSPIESPVPNSLNYTRIPRVKFDKDGNLWVVNDHAKSILKVLKKDGSWVSLEYEDIAEFPTVVDILFDSRGWLWLTSYQAIPGVFCAKINNTPLDIEDDVTKIVTNNFTNQDAINYVIDIVYCIKEDREGKIWIGTNKGLFVINEAEKFFRDGTFTQIKVPRNDGSGLADYLFSGAQVSVIEVDGANRKWVGTNNGVYLISADGLETIHHFTKDNSPLLSNDIKSIAVNHKSGEVFIGTSAGIVSYTSDATEAMPELSSNTVYAYPNPVKPSYNGLISITGLTHDCEIKIVDAAGYLITEGHSVGGKFTWNGRNASGEKVSSGVYYVLMYDEKGDESLATKILVVR